jgi:hypothetical protein
LSVSCGEEQLGAPPRASAIAGNPRQSAAIDTYLRR